MAREHNNANMLAMGARVIGTEVGKQIAEKFLTTEFKSDHENHPRRVAKLLEIDDEE
jgi:ribose 5-phosphate isomerase B